MCLTARPGPRIPRWSCTRWVWLFIGVLIIIYLKIRYFQPSCSIRHYLSSADADTISALLFPTASPSEFRARGFIAWHVRGRGVPTDGPASSAWGLWAPSQGIHAASCWAADQAAGGGGLQKLSEHWIIFHVFAEVVFGYPTLSMWISMGSTPSLSLCRLTTCLWLKMDLSLQIAVKW